MHGRTYNVLQAGDVVTVWGEGAYSGERGLVVERRPPKGIKIKLDMGHETVEPYRDVAFGDNSAAKNKK